MPVPIDQTAPEVGLTPEEQTKGLDIPKGAKYAIGSHKLDRDPEAQRHLKLVLGWWHYERAKQMDNRAERMKAHDYVDGDQWDPEDEQELEDRGQYPFVYNLMKSTQDWLAGTESRIRFDYLVLPRSKDASKAAESKTKLLKYIQDITYARYNRSLSFSDQSISGLGWRDVGIRTDETEDPIYVRYEDWRNVWHDSCGKQQDGADWRYVFRTRIVDYDIAVAMFPDRKDVLWAQLHSQGDSLIDEYDEASIDPEIEELSGSDLTPFGTDTRRDRLRIVGVEYRMPASVQIVRGKELGSLNGAIFDSSNEALARLVQNGFASLHDSVRMVMYRMIFCGHHILQWGLRRYNHNRFSLIPQWAYRKKRDGTPYGVSKQQMDPQMDLNKRRAKALWHLSSNQMVIQDKNWVDFDDLVEEKDRPDGVMVVKDVTQMQLRDYTKSAISAEHVRLMEQDASFIESNGGVTDEARGVQTNATSGRAIRQRQEQANINTAKLFDNALFAFQLEGEITLSLAEQFYSEERTIRVTGNDGKPEYIDFNVPAPDGGVLNDITATQCDFVIDASNYAATIRQAMFEQLGEMLGKIPPEIALQILDMWVELSDLPGREAMVQRIRKINGQTDPNEDPEDPQVIARKEAEAQAAQEQKALQEAMIKLEMQLKEAQANKESAMAEKALADARATLAGIKTKMEEVRVKKATALSNIEARRFQEANPQLKALPGGKKNG
jgi:hypothetical protein